MGLWTHQASAPLGGANLTPSEKRGHPHDGHANVITPVLLIRLQSHKLFIRRSKLAIWRYILIYKML